MASSAIIRLSRLVSHRRYRGVGGKAASLPQGHIFLLKCVARRSALSCSLATHSPAAVLCGGILSWVVVPCLTFTKDHYCCLRLGQQTASS